MNFFFNLVSNNLESTSELCFIGSIIGIKIILKIANIEIKAKPVLSDNIITFEISKAYLQIFNLLYYIDSSFN